MKKNLACFLMLFALYTTNAQSFNYQNLKGIWSLSKVEIPDMLEYYVANDSLIISPLFAGVADSSSNKLKSQLREQSKLNMLRLDQGGDYYLKVGSSEERGTYSFKKATREVQDGSEESDITYNMAYRGAYAVMYLKNKKSESLVGYEMVSGIYRPKRTCSVVLSFQGEAYKDMEFTFTKSW